MKINLELTIVERLRVVVGVLLALGGIVLITIIGAAYGYTNTIIWIVGLGLIVAGGLTASSPEVVEFIGSLLRY